MIDVNVIHTELNFSSKDQIIRYMSDKLLEFDYIDSISGFIDDVKEREKIGPTYIGNYISIPHTRSKHVLKPIISIAKLKNFVNWNDEENSPVKLVFLFVIGCSNDHIEEYMKMLSILFSKLDNMDLNSLLNEPISSEEFLQRLNF